MNLLDNALEAAGQAKKEIGLSTCAPTSAADFWRCFVKTAAMAACPPTKMADCPQIANGNRKLTKTAERFYYPFRCFTVYCHYTFVLSFCPEVSANNHGFPLCPCSNEFYRNANVLFNKTDIGLCIFRQLLKGLAV